MDIVLIAEWLGHLKELGLGAGALKLIQLMFRIQPGDIPVCNTRVMPKHRGVPWSKRIGVHPLEDGRLRITAIEETGTEDENGALTQEQSFQTLRGVSRRMEPGLGPA